jgi:hypothetical protein
MRECNNSKIHISSNLLLSICLIIMLDTLLLEMGVTAVLFMVHTFAADWLYTSIKPIWTRTEYSAVITCRLARSGSTVMTRSRQSTATDRCTATEFWKTLHPWSYSNSKITWLIQDQRAVGDVWCLVKVKAKFSLSTP